MRYLQLGYWGFDGVAHVGELIVHQDVVPAIRQVFEALWLARFPIRSMRLIDDYGGDDFTSIEADNTSAFNCRFVEGTSRWSNHATGTAIDINPLENPYVSGGTTAHPGSEPYIDRVPGPGVILEGGPVTVAFDAVGWEWGGRWVTPWTTSTSPPAEVDQLTSAHPLFPGARPVRPPGPSCARLTRTVDHQGER